jgi:predicted DNA-binding transcriptional regulator YafY
MRSLTSHTPPDISRRNLFGGIALAMLMPQPLSAAQVAGKLAALDLVTLHSLLRGLVFLKSLGDPVIDEDATALLDQIGARLPEAPLLVALYRAYSAGSPPFWRDEDFGDLSHLHRAVAEARAVSFDYTDLQGAMTKRRVLPLALVHPPHGIQLLAWCELRDGYRKFFVGSIDDLTPHKDSFAGRRQALLEGLLESEGISA